MARVTFREICHDEWVAKGNGKPMAIILQESTGGWIYRAWLPDDLFGFAGGVGYRKDLQDAKDDVKSIIKDMLTTNRPATTDRPRRSQ